LENLQLLVDLHINEKRQGPGGFTETKRALEMTMLDTDKPLNIADIGCGTGASTIDLAKMLNANITAVDFFGSFLTVMMKNAAQQGVSDRINPLECSMDDLPFEDDQFDLIWSEGAIYNIGFKNGLSMWKRFLKPDGIIAVSEIMWLTDKRPKEIQDYWDSAYSEMGTASEKMKIIEELGYTPIGYFPLPEHCWLNNYYIPTEKRFESFLEQYPNNKEARELVESEKEEISIYREFKSYFSYGFFIAKRCD